MRAEDRETPHAFSQPRTLLDLLTASADLPAIVLPDHDLCVTYGSLRRQVQAAADALASAGIGRGDRIGMALPNGLPAIVGLLAASAAGTAAPLNPAYKEDEFRFYLEDTQARVLLLPPEGADEARRAAEDRVRVLTIDLDPTGAVSIADVVRARTAPPPEIGDVALILHTSGSTGRPKRVPLSHANLSISAQNVARSYALTADDVSLCVMPLFHVHGLVASTLATLATGGTVVVPRKFNPFAFWRIAKEHGVTWYSAVPTIHQALVARRGTGRPAGTERLRFIRSCSAALAPQLMQEVESAFGVPVLEAYGMTEAAHQIASNRLPPSVRKPGSVGRGTDVQVSIMDAQGTHQPSGERGEIGIKGPNVITGYENHPEANATAFVDGWFRTGDQGYIDEGGYLTITGRLKELINRGGEKVSPREIDELLLSHPAVAEAVCFGVPDVRWGEEVEAVVVARGSVTARELLAFCAEHLAEFKLPKQIHLTEAIPRTVTGKIQRRLVAQAFGPKSL